ncbi:CBS domain-containing protein [Lentzea sp. NBC_00516]|uniref:CBS domain-containing protein n=1 Tax=Lentzea sp. NBC_00516 TaxID=2903582 RepID=UPI002E7FCAE7|nr:CBS domain-containing protein [Lentzea sp. NBC_00516]WUD27202.1 CBS domain-containing protein [Lentzea sp. NBC_00516]
MRTRDVMTTDVVVVSPKTAARDAARLLAEHGFTALPVVDDSGELVGIVSETELLKDRLPQDPRSLVHGEPVEARKAPADLVSQVMRAPATVTPNTDLAEVADLMLERGVRSVPVVYEGHLAGIVTRRDLLRSISRADWIIEAEIRHRLAIVGDAHRWTVEVSGGRASIVDEMDNDTDRHVAEVLARAVAGVTDVRVAAPERI